MAFQSTVAAQIGFGVVGELAYEGPLRAQPAILDSTTPANNIFGRGATIKAGATGAFVNGSTTAADPKPLVAAIGEGAGVFAGLLVSPKEHALAGTSAGGTLAASLTLPNGVPCNLATEGDFNVQFAAATNPGDSVFVRHTDGVLITTAPGAATPANSIGPIGTVERFVANAANIGVVHLEPIVRPGA